MEKDQKHLCKFCYKIFPCARSLGGHLRSHLINISSPDHPKSDKLPKKKHPPLTNAKTYHRTNILAQGSAQSGHVLRENPKKTKKFSNKSQEDTLLEEKICKECGKTFQSWKALFGHMKCHSLVGRATKNLDEDSWNSSSDHQKQMMDKLSDNEAATPLCRRKRSDLAKRYTTTMHSPSLTVANLSPCVSEIDQQEQEEVAMSLILLSVDVGNLRCMNSVVESLGTSFEVLEAKRSAKASDSDTKISHGECSKFKELRNGKLEPEIRTPRKRSADQFRVVDKFYYKNLDVGYNESEVTSPKTLTEQNGLNQFGSACKKKNSSKRKCIDLYDSESNSPLDYKLAYDPSDISEFYQDFEKKSKFTCVICKKAFPSYQALGGHRASHKKFKGCCAPTTKNNLETENSPNQSENLGGVFGEKIDMGVVWKRNKEHECPICFKIFPSGQALGGHKRSHLTSDQSKSSDPSVCTDKQIPEIHNFLDLNLPAPVEEPNDFKPWWMGTSHKNQHELSLLGLLSS